MRTGQRRELITFRRSCVTTQSSFGEQVTTVSTVEEDVWAAVRTVRSDEVFLDQERRVRTLKEFNIRYSTGITESMSVVHDSKTYDIKSIEDPQERHRELVILGEIVT